MRWTDTPEALFLAMGAVAMFGTTFIFFTALLKIVDKMTDEKEARKQIESHKARSSAGSDQTLRRKDIQSRRWEPSSSSGTQMMPVVGNASRSTPPKHISLGGEPKAVQAATSSYHYKDGTGQNPVKRTASSRGTHQQEVDTEAASAKMCSKKTRFLAQTRWNRLATLLEVHSADYWALDDCCPRVDPPDSSLYRHNIPVRFDDQEQSSQLKNQFPKYWAQDQRQQVKIASNLDRRYQQHPAHVSKRRSADVQAGKSDSLGSQSTFDEQAQHVKTSKKNHVQRKCTACNKSMLALYGKEYESLLLEFHHIEEQSSQNQQEDCRSTGERLSASCGSMWNGNEELSSAQRRLI